MDATKNQALTKNEALTVEEIDVWQVGTGFDNSVTFFDSEAEARELCLSQNSSRTAGLYQRRALRLSDGRICLYQPDTIFLYSSASEMLRRNALKKLTDGEKGALGLLDQEALGLSDDASMASSRVENGS